MIKTKKRSGYDLAAKYKNILKGKGVFFLFLALGLGFLGLTACSSDDKELKAKFSFQINGFTVQFTNESENATRYEWDFGDFTTSTDENPEHEYLSANTFTVTLKAFDGSDNSDTASNDVMIINTALVTDFSCAVPNTDTTGLMIMCTNSSTFGGSETGLTYAWDFGVTGATSTNKEPTYTYAAEGNYTIRLTVTVSGDPTKSRTVTREITITDFSNFLERLTGSTGGANSKKKWILRRSGVALGVWPGAADHPSLDSIRTGAGAWWSFGAATPLHDRPCILDDEYTFEVEGTTMRFVLNTMDTFFQDGGGGEGFNNFGGHKKNVNEVCVEESTEDIWKITRDPITGEEFPDSNNDGTHDIRDYRNKSGEADKGDYTFTLSGAQLTLNGAGSYIGLQAKSNAGDKGYLVPAMRSFRILKLTDTNSSSPDELVLSMPINGGGGGYWVFNLLHYESGTLPPIPTSPCPSTPVMNQAMLPVTFQSSVPSFDGFDGGSAACAANPNTTGNSSTQVMKVTDNGSDINAGVWFQLTSTIDFSTNCGLKMKVYGRAGLEVRFKLEVGGDSAIELSRSVAAANTWETLSFDFRSMVATANRMAYNRLVFFLGSTTDTTAETLHVDDIAIDTTVGACTGT